MCLFLVIVKFTQIYFLINTFMSPLGVCNYLIDLNVRVIFIFCQLFTTENKHTVYFSCFVAKLWLNMHVFCWFMTCRYNIMSEIMQATSIQNLKRMKGMDTTKEFSPKGTSKGDLLRARNLPRYINQVISVRYMVQWVCIFLLCH